MYDITRIKGNQTMKFGQLIKYSIRNVFWGKFYSKSDTETSPRPFSKKSKLSIFLGHPSKIVYSLFLLYVQVDLLRDSSLPKVQGNLELLF